MTDLLTERLHDSAERIPVALRPASETRRVAEHARRVRRTSAGTLVGVVVLAVALVAYLGAAPRSEPTPATTPTPYPTAGVRTLAADPLLTEGGWASWWGADEQPFTREPVTQPLLQCIGDGRRLGAAELHSATFHHPYSAETNSEFVLRYPDPELAARAFAELRNQFTDCHPRQGGRPYIEPWPVPGSYVAPEGPIDAMIVGSVSRGYGTLAAREGNVIVILESSSPRWGERQGPLMMALLDQALGPDWQTRL